MSSVDGVDYTNWDWLPLAAREVEGYILRLLAESGIQPHDVSARAKSIASFHRKQLTKQYADPIGQITDIVAIRIITYSNTDRNRVGELIRSRFAVLPGEDRNPGDGKPSRLRGYDSLHIVVSGEAEERGSDWVVSGGDLERYFATFGGLEIQIRTVAGHAWAEFEHARRYKGAQYNAISDQDKGTIDQLFGAASDARSALDETFVAIDRILARPTVDNESAHIATRDEPATGSEDVASTPLDAITLSKFLRSRFPDDADGSDKGIEFGIELANAVEIDNVEALERALEDVDSDQVRALMASDVSLTQVRRLDDELLARFGQEYIDKTMHTGNRKHRALQLEWRYDRLRGKTRYRTYLVLGEARPTDLEAGPYTAVGALREVVKILTHARGADAVVTQGLIASEPNLPPGTRPKEISTEDDAAIWVASNLNREASEQLMAELLERSRPIDLRITHGDTVVADGRADSPRQRNSH